MTVTQINVQNAFELLRNYPNSVLVDVRTVEEFNSDGVVDAATFNNRVVLLPWMTLPAMQENPEFANVLEKSLEEIFPNNFKDAEILFFCKAGGRSNQAAAYARNLGYKNCHNIIAGLGAWKAENLPWRQK
jgi:rhodanese-related sulfurtransferase